MSRVAVAIHDVAPETLDACAQLRDRIAAGGIGCATLLAIPRSLGSPCTRAPEHVAWLRERRLAGDAIAQHGYGHVQERRLGGPRQWRASLQGGGACEFVGLGDAETARALRLGRAILREAGVEPRGFVAPAYAYTRALRRELPLRYAWWAELTAVRGSIGTLRSPALCLGASTAFKRATSPSLARALARTGGRLMRLDAHPADLHHRGTRTALDSLIELAARRAAVTYDDLMESPEPMAAPAAA